MKQLGLSFCGWILLTTLMNACSPGGSGGGASGVPATTPSDPAHTREIGELYQAWLSVAKSVQRTQTPMSNAIALGIAVGQRPQEFYNDKGSAFMALLASFQEGPDGDGQFTQAAAQLETLNFFKP